MRPALLTLLLLTAACAAWGQAPPPEAPAAAQPRLTIEFSQTDIAAALQQLRDRTGCSFVLGPGVTGAVTGQFTDAPLDKIMRVLAYSLGAVAEQTGGVYVLRSATPVQPAPAAPATGAGALLPPATAVPDAPRGALPGAGGTTGAPYAAPAQSPARAGGLPMQAPTAQDWYRNLPPGSRVSNGVVVLPNGTTILPNGTIIDPNGKVVIPSQYPPYYQVPYGSVPSWGVPQNQVPGLLGLPQPQQQPQVAPPSVSGSYQGLPFYLGPEGLAFQPPPLGPLSLPPVGIGAGGVGVGGVVPNVTNPQPGQPAYTPPQVFWGWSAPGVHMGVPPPDWSTGTPTNWKYGVPPDWHLYQPYPGMPQTPATTQGQPAK